MRYGKAPTCASRSAIAATVHSASWSAGSVAVGQDADGDADPAGRRRLRGGEQPGGDADVPGDRLGRGPGAAAVLRCRRLGPRPGHQHREVLGRGDGDGGVHDRAARGLAAQVDERVLAPSRPPAPRPAAGRRWPTRRRRRRCPKRSKPRRPERQGEVQFDLGGVAGVQFVRRASRRRGRPGRPPRPPRSGRRRRRPPGRRRRPAGCPPGAESGPLGTSRKTSSSHGAVGGELDGLRARHRDQVVREAEVERDHRPVGIGLGALGRAAVPVGVERWLGGGRRGGRRSAWRRCRRRRCSREGAVPRQRPGRPAAAAVMPGGRSRGPGRAPSRRRW